MIVGRTYARGGESANAGDGRGGTHKTPQLVRVSGLGAALTRQAAVTDSGVRTRLMKRSGLPSSRGRNLNQRLRRDAP
jgi:hypothetical protein